MPGCLLSRIGRRTNGRRSQRAVRLEVAAQATRFFPGPRETKKLGVLERN